MKVTFKNLDAIPTKKLKEILDSPNITGIDGADYFQVKEELESELWRRQNIEGEKNIKRFEASQKQLFKEMSKSHKKGKR